MKDPMTTEELSDSLKALNAIDSAQWEVKDNILYRKYQFANFDKAFAFMSRCVPLIDELDHHPDWCNSYNKVSIRLTTHETGGLTQMDFKLASKMEELAQQY